MKGCLLEKGTYFENLTFGECALIRSFMVVQDDKSVCDII